jgi:hypothetical protein
MGPASVNNPLDLDDALFNGPFISNGWDIIGRDGYINDDVGIRDVSIETYFIFEGLFRGDGSLLRLAASGGTGKAVMESGLTVIEDIPIPGSRVFASQSELPPVTNGATRVFRGTGSPEVPQVGIQYRGNPASAPDGATNFMSQAEANIHATARGTTTGVSVSTDVGTARLANPNVVVYDVPNSVFNQLPTGDKAQFERVFFGSVPNVFRIGRISPR